MTNQNLWLKHKLKQQWVDDIIRREKAATAIDFYNHVEDEYITERLSGIYPQNYDAICKYKTKYPLTQRVINDISISFQDGVDISIIDNDKLSDKLNQILSEFGLNKTLQKVDKLSNLLFKVGVIPAFRNNKITLDIITPDECFVEQSKTDPTEITKLYYSINSNTNSPQKSVEIVQYQCWTKYETYIVEVCHQTGSILILSEPEPHNYGEIPVAWFETDFSTNSFWLDKENSVVNTNEVVDLELTNLRYILANQAFSTLITTGLDSPIPLEMGPGSYLNLPFDESTDTSPTANYITPAAKFTEYWKIINDLIADSAQSMGLSVDSYKSSNSFNSGFQLKLSKSSIFNRATITRTGYIPSIDKLVKLIMQTYNFNVTNLFGVDSVELNINFPEFTVETSTIERMENHKAMLEIGLTSKIMILMKENNLTRENAIKLLEQINSDNGLEASENKII